MINKLFDWKTKRFGHAISFPVSEGWIPRLMRIDMTRIWKRAGIDAKGLNFCTIGKAKNGISTRFIKDSPYYQAWLGGYLAQIKEPWSTEMFYRLAVADQNAWLRIYGDRDPMTKVLEARNHERTHIDGYEADMIKGTMLSHADVGSRKIWNFPFLKMAMAAETGEPSSVFDPHQEDGYEEVTLQGQFYVVHISETVKAVLYGCGTKKTYPILRREIESSLKATTIKIFK